MGKRSWYRFETIFSRKNETHDRRGAGFNRTFGPAGRQDSKRAAGKAIPTSGVPVTVIVRTGILWVSTVVLGVLAGLGVYYADLLHSAFEQNPIPRTAQSIERGKLIFLKDCAICHGAEGRGDGPAAASLAKHPEDLTQIAAPPWFPDGVVAYRIANGRELMPAWKGVLSAGEIWDLINYIRSQRRD